MPPAPLPRRLRQRPAIGWAIGLGAFALAFALRWSLQGFVLGLPYITFFTAVLVAGIFGSLRIGVTVLVLSFVSALYFFVPPYQSFEVERPADILGLSIFAIGGAVELYLIEVMSRTIAAMHVAHERSQTLFKELQHRVANNLTFVAAMLNQQRKQFDRDSPAAAALKASQQRLLMMSQVHRRLYNPEFVDEPVGAHLERLGRDLIDASGVQGVTLTLAADAAVLPLDRLVPLSLIVSELITNCLKHAFADRHSGVIALTFRINEAGICMLTVEDDGIGMSLYSASDSGLGRSIVKSLLGQLQATIQTDGDIGTRTTIRFARTA